MNDIYKLFNVVFTYGSFAKPFVIKILNSNSPSTLKNAAYSLLYTWNFDFEKAIYHIDRSIKSCSSTNIKYFLLSRKLSCLSKIGKFDISLYNYLKKNLDKVNVVVREEIENLLINLHSRYFDTYNMKSPRFWGRNKNKSTLIFDYIGIARKFAKRGTFSKATTSFINSFRIAKEIPHPSGMVTSLNGLAWYLKDFHPKISYNLSKCAVFYLGFYNEDIGTDFAVIDTIFEIEKILLHKEIFKTLRIMSCLDIPQYYIEKYKKDFFFIPDFNLSCYEITDKLKECISSSINSYRNEKVSPATLVSILNGKSSKIKGVTLRKLIKEISFNLPFPILNELAKMQIDEKFEENLEKLTQYSKKEKKIMFLSTYIAQLKTSKKFEGGYFILDNPNNFKKHMKKSYETREFVLNMIDAHPYIEGRKQAVGKMLEHMSENKLNEFFNIYSNLKIKEQKIMNEFIRNYGRYERVKFDIKLTGNETIKKFSEKYNLKKQASYISYWCFEKKSERKKIEEILKLFVESSLV